MRRLATLAAAVVLLATACTSDTAETTLAAETSVTPETTSTVDATTTSTPTIPSEPGESFFERFPAWDMPDLALTDPDFEPQQARPRETVVVSVEVTNGGTGDSEPALLHFSIGGTRAETVDVPALAPGETTRRRMAWTAGAAGLHQVVAEIVPAPGQVDADAADNRVDGRIWVAGEGDLVADVEMELVAADEQRGPIGGFTLNTYNPSFAALEPVDAAIWLDGEQYGEIVVGPIEPGGRASVPLDLESVPPGDHVLTLQMEWPDHLHDSASRSVAGWHVGFPGLGQLAEVIAPGTWTSLGPRILVKAQPDGSQGRIDHLVVDPDDSTVLYASAVRGGLWHSTDGGQSWQELTDDLSKTYAVAGGSSPLAGGAIAIDPDDSNIIYYGTGSSRYGGGVGIFKTIDGGQIWHRIATETVCTGVSEIHVERTSSGVIVYAATDQGLIRHINSDPKDTTIATSDWTTLWSGRIEDMAVDPSEPGRVYIPDIDATRPHPDGGIVRVLKGLYRCSDADTATGNASCVSLAADLPAMNTNSSIRIDLFRDDPRIIYASVQRARAFDAAAPRLEIYRSDNRGDDWALEDSFGDNEPNKNGLYNPYIRVHPSDSSRIWFGGVNLFEMDLDDSQPTPVPIFPPHDDQHGMTFDPNDDGLYYAVGDGGVWRCEVAAGTDTCVHRNTDLRVMELYDMDVAENDPSLITGGTQDNGTILFTGSLDWNQAGQPRGGDGLYSPICPSNHNVMISQHQQMDSADLRYTTWISATGPQGPWIQGLASSTDLPKAVRDLSMRGAFLTFRPTNPDVVATIGDQVYATANATDFTMDGNVRRSTAIWEARGPAGSNVLGTVTRVLFQPDANHWFAGTSEGQIWRSNHGIEGTWNLLWTHSDNAKVIDMAFAPTDKDVLYVLFAGGPAYRRVLRLQGLSTAVTGTPLGDNFPANRKPRAISGDGYDADKVYVGTDKGVFEGDLSRPTYDRWKPYNDGMPLTRINDLVVPTGRITEAGPSSVMEPERNLFVATRGRGVWMVDTGP